MKALFCSLAIGVLSASSTFASVTVSSPVNGSTVTSPFTLVASAGPCSTQAIASMGYSLDNSSSTTVVKSAALSASVTASLGSHTLHVKSWGTGGASCTANVTISVVQPTSAPVTNVVVSSPANGASVQSPFGLAAAGTLCSGQAITAMGYSLDTSSSTTTASGAALNAEVSASAGSHTLHVKSWGKGTSCVTNLAITVLAPPPGPSIPSTANVVNAIQNTTAWHAQHDARTSGTSTGTMNLVDTPSISGSARNFATSYTSYGGERYNVSLALDQVSTNFVYDTQIYIASPSTDVANIEMDLNQVTADGNTVIFGFQCDGWSHTWDYTANTGTIANPDDHWIHSTQACSPQKWTTNTWHHLQVQYSRDSSGDVTYKAVWLDGVEQDLNVTVLSAFALGWAPSFNSNFQIDGSTSTSGSSSVYLDNLTLYSW